MVSQRNISFLKHWVYMNFSWMMKLSIKLMTWMLNGSLILNKLERRRVKLYQRMMAMLQCQLSKCEHFYHSLFFFFPCPTLILLFFAPKLHQLGVVTRLTQKYLVQKVLNLYSG